MKNFLKFLLPSFLFVLTLLIVGSNLGKPFWGEHDWNGARYGNIARNYLRYGIFETKFGQVENGGLSDIKDIVYYTHYQPLLPILISLSYRINGVSEYATRMVPLIATAGLIATIYFIGYKLLNWQTGLFASLLALATPMVRYFGKNPVHEPLALFFAALTFLSALSFKKEKRGLWLTILGLILTALTNWSFVFLLVGLTAFLYERKNRKVLVTLWGLAILMAGLHFLHVYILTGSLLGGGLSGAFLERTSVDQVLAKFGPIDYILRIRLWLSTLFTNTLLLATLVGLVLLIKPKQVILKRFILSVAIFCIYPVFFANASFIHSYFIYYFTLPLSLLAGYFGYRLINYRKSAVIIALLLIAGVWFERMPYIKALEESRGDALAVEAAESIKSKTSERDRTLVIPSEYGVSRMPILSYYSDRNVVLTGNANWELKIKDETYELTKITGR